MAKIIKTDGTIEDVKLDKENKLKHLQKLVGGFIEILHMDDGRKLIVNEEGFIKGLEDNPKATQVARTFAPKYLCMGIKGNAVVCEADEVD